MLHQFGVRIKDIRLHGHEWVLTAAHTPFLKVGASHQIQEGSACATSLHAILWLWMNHCAYHTYGACSIVQMSNTTCLRPAICSFCNCVFVLSCGLAFGDRTEGSENYRILQILLMAACTSTLAMPPTLRHFRE